MEQLNGAVPSLHRSLLVHPTVPVTTALTQVPTPQASNLTPSEVLIQVSAAAINPKDYQHVISSGHPSNSGDDLSGTILTVGKDVTHLHVGDRVAAFHQIGAPYGAFAEYAVVTASTTFVIPDELGWEEAAVLPMNSLTAALTLFRRQSFVPPWEEGPKELNKRKALLVYGAGTALAGYVIQLAKFAGARPIVAIGGPRSDHARELLDLKGDDGDIMLDYSVGMDVVKTQVAELCQSRSLAIFNAIDTVNQDKSWVHCSQMILTGGIVSVFSSALQYNEPEIQKGVRIVYTFVGTGHTGRYLGSMPKQPPTEDVAGDPAFTRKFFAWLKDMVHEGQYRPHPHRTFTGGLSDVETALQLLQAGQTGGKKFVVTI